MFKLCSKPLKNACVLSRITSVLFVICGGNLAW